MKVLSLFSGIGAFEKAFDNLGIPYDLVAYCEIDKYASKSYAAIHNVSESMNLGDITKVDEKELPTDIDLITYGFPCQDISLAGKQKGLFNEDGSQTRSGLFFEALRIIEATKPRVAIAENVKNLTGKKFKEQFKIVLASLDQAGYNNYWQVLNAKDFGVPQNRERVFIVSIRKDVDKPFFHFPEGFPLEIRLKDILEESVDEKYYLSDEFMTRFLASTQNAKYPCGNEYTVLVTTKAETDRMGTNSRHWVYDTDGCMSTLDATGYKQPKQILVRVREATKLGYAEAVEGDSINLEQPNSKTRRGRVGKQVAQTLTTSPQQAVVEPQVLRQVRTDYGKEIRKSYESGETTEKWGNMKRFEPRNDGISNTLSTVQKDNLIVEPMAYDEQNGYIRQDGCVGTITTDGSSPKHNNRVIVWDGFNQRVRADQSCVGTLTRNCGADLKRNGQGIIENGADNLRIRKLTPKECFRLMGFDDSDFEKAEAVNSNTQLYKQAGNSIVVPVIEYIIEALFDCDALN